MTQSPPISDAELWTDDSADAFSHLYVRHARAVTAYFLQRTADPELADDLTSVVFLEAWRKRATVTITTPTARPYLLGIATNVMKHQWRTLRRHRTAVKALAGHRLPPTDDEAETIDRIDAIARLAQVRDRVNSLPLRDREVLALIAWGELTYEEAAEVLDVPVGTVRSRLSRARQRLGTDSTIAHLATPLTPAPIEGPTR